MLISALTITGTLRLAPLARLVLWCEEQRGQVSRMKKDELAKRLQLSPRTVRYWIKQLEQAGILVVEERRFEAGGSKPNELAIDWPGVQKLAVDRGANRGAKTPDRGAKIAPPLRKYLLKNNTTYQPYPPPCHNPRPSEAWDRVVVEVGLLGVEQAAKAVAAIAEHGGTPGVVRELIAAFESRQSQWVEARRPIVLYRRLRLWRSGQDVTQGWPGPDGAIAAHERVAAAQRVGRW
ncbi:MAG: helix-turn-helix domain-containing protein [Pirellulales bacterium]